MTRAKPYIALAAGGTGGHMMPAEGVADALKGMGFAVSLVTDIRGDAIGNVFKGVDRHVLSATSHMGGGLVGKLRAGISLIASTLDVRKQFKKRRPAAVVGFGGYPSMPAVLAARSLGIPYVLHEQNAVLGRVNRWMAPKAAALALTLPKTQRVPEGVNTVVTGNPVRQTIIKLANIAYATPLAGGPIRLFILGGSQGARILSDVVPAAVALLSPDYRDRLDIVHQARNEDVERVRAAYAAAGVKADVQPYFNDVGAILLRTQLVICRAGASTLAEIMAMGRPAILVPLAIAADDHQRVNADFVETYGGGWVMGEKDFKPEALASRLTELFDDMVKLRQASENIRQLTRLDSAQKVADLVQSIVAKEGKA